jgi:hypothetical protein
MEQSQEWSPLWRSEPYGEDDPEQYGRHARIDDGLIQESIPVADGTVTEAEPVGRHRADSIAETTTAEVEAESVVVDDEITEQHEAGRLERLWNGIKRNKVAVAAGAITVASMVASPIGDTIKSLAETASYVGPGMIAAEAAWIGGAAMMLGAIGKKIINPLKIHKRFKEIPDAAAESTLFKSGLAINTVAAVAEFVIPTVAVTTKLPVESWGILSFAAVDLIATVALRKVIWNGMHRTKSEPPEA